MKEANEKKKAILKRSSKEKILFDTLAGFPGYEGNNQINEVDNEDTKKIEIINLEETRDYTNLLGENDDE